MSATKDDVVEERLRSIVQQSQQITSVCVSWHDRFQEICVFARLCEGLILDFLDLSDEEREELAMTIYKPHTYHGCQWVSLIEFGELALNEEPISIGGYMCLGYTNFMGIEPLWPNSLGVQDAVDVMTYKHWGEESTACLYQTSVRGSLFIVSSWCLGHLRKVLLHLGPESDSRIIAKAMREVNRILEEVVSSELPVKES